ncbi:hypothetical protein PG984_010211 [Apiospora sp. TS-2023a]
MVALLLSSGASTAVKDDEGRTALHHAARNGREAVVEALIDHGADITAETNDGLRPEQLARDSGYEGTADLFTGRIPVSKKGLEQSRLQLVATLVAAAASDNVPQLARLLSRDGGGGPLISVLDPDGRRALSAAAENGHGDAVEYLIQQGSHIDARDANGETALWWASRNGHVQVVKTLLRLEASIEIGDLDGLTPLCAAAQKGHEAVADALLRRGGDPNAVTTYGRTPLMFATLAGNLEMVELLVNNGAQVGYSHPRYGVAASSLASAGEGNEKIRFFLEMHETIDFFHKLYDAVCQSGDVLQPKKEVDPDPDLAEALVEAAQFGLVAEIKRLLQAGADSNGEPGPGVPLVAAARGGHFEAVQILIGSGAEINRTNEEDTAALGWAALLGNLEMIRLLHDHGADLNLPDLDGQTVISHAAEAGSADAVRLLVDLGARIEIMDRALRTPLWYAVANGRKEVAEVLLANGANIECADDHGRTPLLVAAGDGHWDICDLLLRKGAQITRTDAFARRSPLSLAAQFGHESIVELLIEHGAHLDHAARQGLTPLMLAVRGGHAMVVRILLEMGADPGVRDNGNNRTAVSYAKELGQEAALKLLSRVETLRSRNERALKRIEHEALTKRMRHRYAPLPEGFIRLLELHPGKTGDVISFELHDVDLLGDPHIPSFDALSYEWGSKVGTVPVQCNQDRLLITPNCKAAVERLRDEKKSRMLWIDAICINQEDKKECSSQVAMMNRIFRAAKVVLMWLGKEEEDSEAAFSSIPILARAYEQADRSSFGASVASFGAGAILEAVNTIPDQEQVANGWASLARRTYFQRAWIFQEVILAGSRGLVLCGALSSPWDPFKAALQGYMAWQGDWVGSTGLVMENDDEFREAGKLSFPEALAAMTRLGCSDARDKVFATLGLVEQDYIAADYTSSLEEVMVKANVLILHTTKTLWHWQFTRSHDGPTNLHGLPSWAVDFTQPARAFAPPWEESVECWDFIPNRNRHRASLAGSLYIDGSIVDRVVCTAAITIDKETFDIAKPIIQAMSRSRRGVYDLYPSAGKIQNNKGEKKKKGRRCPTRRKTNGEALLAAMLKSYGGDESTREVDADMEAFLAWKLSRWEDDGIIPVDHDHIISQQPPPTHLQSRVAAWDARSRNAPKTFDLDVCRRMERRHRFGRHLVYTEKGYLGISDTAEVGEGMAVVVLGAAHDLTVLKKRKTQEEEGDAECYYERVGSVFLYGWDKQRITTLEDIDGNAEVARLEIR